MKSPAFQAVMLATLLLLLPACGGNPGEAEGQYNAGEAFMEVGEWEDAIDRYDRAIRLDPQFADAYASRGRARFFLGEFQQALEDLDEAIRLDPGLAMAYNNRGIVHAALGWPEQAIQDFDRAIMLDPRDSEAYYNRGHTRGIMAQLELAILDFDEAIRLDPQALQAYNNRGVALDKQGKLAEANADFTQAIEIDPRDACRIFGLPCTIGFLVPAAYFLIHRFPDDFEKAVLNAVNAGGNCMARAALTGGVSGAMVGIQGIPERFITGLKDHQRLLGLAEQIAAGETKITRKAS